MELKERFLAAAKYGQYKHIKNLLKSNNSRVRYQNENGSSALMLASENGHGKICELLLTNGAHVDWQNKTGETALMLASVNGHIEVIKK